MPRSVTVEEKTATGEERDAMETNIGKKIQDTDQEFPPQYKYAKEMTIPEGNTTMTNVDSVWEKFIGQELP